MSRTTEIPLDDIRPNPNNPREGLQGIDELADSIAQQGLLQPVLVRPDADEYELVHGERRLRAVESLGWDTIPSTVKELSDGEALEMAITENLQREDITEIAEARSYKQLIDEFDLTQTEAADRLGVTQGHISNRLSLLDLPDTLQENILYKILTPWQAKEVARVWGEYYIVDFVIDFDLSVTEIRRIVDDLQDGKDPIEHKQTWSSDTLGSFWGYADGIDGETTIVSGSLGDPASRTIDRVDYVDGNGEPVTVLHEAETTAGLHWAKKNLNESPFNDMEPRLYDESDEINPIRIHWPTQQIVLGYNRLKLADEYGYTGDFEVELLFASDFFAWESRVIDDMDGEGDL
jgi:ParB family chromosome partitioning protein